MIDLTNNGTNACVYVVKSFPMDLLRIRGRKQGHQQPVFIFSDAVGVWGRQMSEFALRVLVFYKS